MYRISVIFLTILFINAKILSKVSEDSVLTNVITGAILDTNTSNPLEFLNVSLLSIQDSSYIDGTLTDSLGQFKLSTTDIGDAVLRITYMNHEINRIPINIKRGDNNIGSISCQYSTYALDEVTVRSNVSAIKNDGAKLIFNIESTPFRKGYTGLDVLKVTPKINVSSSGEIKIRNKDAKVMINGRLIPSEQISYYVQSINSNEIKSIEVDSFNSADKDGDTQGGTINIVTKSVDKGFYSTIRSMFSYSKDNYYSQQTGIRLNYGSSNYNVYGSYYFNNGNDFSEATTTYKKQSSQQIAISEYDSKLYPRKHNYVLGTKVNLNQQHSLGVEFSGINDIPLKTKGDGEIKVTDFDLLHIDRAYSKSKIKNTSDLYNTVASYNWQMGENTEIKALGGYFKHKIQNDNSLISHFELNSLNDINELNISNAKTENYFAQIDFMKNLQNNLSYQFGSKYSVVDRRSDLTSNNLKKVSKFDSKVSSYKYKEKIAAIYAMISKNLFDRLDLNAGLRYEYTSIYGFDTEDSEISRHYNDLFPSISLTYQMNEEMAYSLSYSKSIFRPSFALLSNSIVRVDEEMYDVGNPSLRPQFVHKYELNFNYKSHNFALYHENVSKAITENWTVGDNIIYHTNINGKSIKYYGLDYSLSQKILPFLYSNAYVGLKYTYIPSSYYKKRNLSALISNYNVFSLTEKSSIDLFVEYSSPSISPNAYIKSDWNIGLAYSHTLMKDKLNIKFSILDIFNTKKDRVEVRSPQLEYSLYQKNLTRGIVLSVFYSFGRKEKSKTENVDYLNESIDRL